MGELIKMSDHATPAESDTFAKRARPEYADEPRRRDRDRDRDRDRERPREYDYREPPPRHPVHPREAEVRGAIAKLPMSGQAKAMAGAMVTLMSGIAYMIMNAQTSAHDRDDLHAARIEEVMDARVAEGRERTDAIIAQAAIDREDCAERVERLEARLDELADKIGDED